MSDQKSQIPDATREDAECWGVFEVEFNGPDAGNPFEDVALSADFRAGNRVVPVRGFYDGNGIYKIRFMPDAEGEWTWSTESNVPELNGRNGAFVCTAATGGNHGPVRVAKQFHFAYEDGTPYYPFGTTCYVWNHQGDALEEQTLATLRQAPFNKMRMCIFPKHYSYSSNEPEFHPFEGSLEDGWDFRRPNPEFWHHLEKRIGNLRDLGIEADLILFHPYDRWGYAKMDAETDDFYLQYAVARLAAYRNVWWSFANEWDLMKAKTEADWDRYFRLVQTEDPSQHLRSIHNCRQFYDHGKPWVTHCCIQRPEPSKTPEWRQSYGKPVVDDECHYEGDIHQGWGNNPPEETVRKFWDGCVRGGYVGHGETYYNEEEVLWWSKGGTLRGGSPDRIAFLREIIEEGPHGISPMSFGGGIHGGGIRGEYYLGYLGNTQSRWKTLTLPEDATFEIDIIDTWDMTIEKAEGTYSGACRVDLPGKPYVALRVRRQRPERVSG